MRDKRFVANHVGGPLTIENHKLLMNWAIKCVEHAINTANMKAIDKRALNAIQIAKDWEKGAATVGEARNAAFSAHEAARENNDKISQAIIRACGHAVATAHMADHSIKTRAYILKGLKLFLDKNELENEKKWQIENADDSIKELIKE